MNRNIGLAAALLMLDDPAVGKTQMRSKPTRSKLARCSPPPPPSSGQPIVLPQGNIQLITSIYEVPPGAKLPEHEHNSQRYGYLMSGRLRITNTETGKSVEFKPGDFIVEARGQWHKAENIGAEPIKLLVIDQVEPGEKTTVLRQPERHGSGEVKAQLRSPLLPGEALS